MNAITPAFRIEQIGNATLYLGDCREVLPTLAGVDAVVTDPPYGTTSCGWDRVVDPKSLWPALGNVVADVGAMVFFGCQPFSSLMVVSNLDWFKYQWVWDKVSKTDFMNAKNKPLREHEDILVFSKGTTANKSLRRMTYNPQGIEAPSRHKADNRNAAGYMGTARPSHTDHYNYQASNYPSSILRFSNADRGEVEHPTQKPVDLLCFLVATYSNDGETILDPFMGSGTTGVACARRGRQFVGCEINPAYFDVACRRIEQAQRQADLFVSPVREDPSFMRTGCLFDQPED